MVSNRSQFLAPVERAFRLVKISLFHQQDIKNKFSHLYKIELEFIVHKNASIVPKSDISIDKMKSIIYE
jgi:hypothetical protein